MSARWLDAVPRRPPIGEAFTREREALADGQIRLNLWRFAAHWRDLRAGVLREVDFESLRERMASAKEAVLADFERHRGAFREAASRAGWVLHEAATAPEACEVVARLARERGVRLAVKTKSMVTEEIDLNAHLSQEGVPCVETDLGEWIIQLAGEHPSHMVIPAIHKNRRQVGGLFERVLGRPVPREDIPEQVAQARRELRELFLAAGMGISGANALIAPTGTVVMVTNEGNGRLTTSLPPLHVVVSGYDKLLPDWDAAAVLLRLLARSASGQRITTYTTFLTGPRRAEQERHIVLVDNGRTAMRQDPLFRDALRCIRCAACANVCPSYQVVGGHAFGHVYTGPIGLVTTPFHHGLEPAAGPPALCVGCGACDTVCPSKIPISRLIGAVR
ncbi:MAG: lactate utilization protein, partial [Planctomycetes bacterium]|nr:lactate utilization protein [Planctomycetota bacterium]